MPEYTLNWTAIGVGVTALWGFIPLWISSKRQPPKVDWVLKYKADGVLLVLLLVLLLAAFFPNAQPL